MSYNIEVCLSDDLTNTDKGRILEDLGKEVLESMQFTVKEEIRLTGMEVDLLAKHKVSGEEIYVECKAHKNPLPADVITKILGNLMVNDVSSGWRSIRKRCKRTSRIMGEKASGQKKTIKYIHT